MSLTLEDLAPQEVTFKLCETGEKTYTLRKFSLADQIWMGKRFGDEAQVQKIFDKMMLAEITEIAHHQLKEKDQFETFMDFAAIIITTQDKLNVVKGLLATIGFSQPVLNKLEKEILGKRSKKE